MDEPWFKFFAQDYLCDPGVDEIPPEAQGLLVRIWCVCHIEGSCPLDPEEIARKTRLKLSYVSQHLSRCLPLFEVRDGRLYSRRMEKEKEKSAAASKSAKVRWGRDANRNADRNANGNAIRNPQKSDSESESNSSSKRTAPISPLQGTGAASTSFVRPNSRDLRNVAKEVEKINATKIAGHCDEEDIFNLACARWNLDPDAVRSAAGRPPRKVVKRASA
jgi:hypothetical protein